MKAMVQSPVRSLRNEVCALSPESFKIKKSSHENEMRELYYKLRELVPNGNKLATDMELLQNVIDYMLDLTDTLHAQVCTSFYHGKSK